MSSTKAAQTFRSQQRQMPRLGRIHLKGLEPKRQDLAGSQVVLATPAWVPVILETTHEQHTVSCCTARPKDGRPQHQDSSTGFPHSSGSASLLLQLL